MRWCSCRFLAAHKFDVTPVSDAVLAFIAFSFCASSVYIFNDLVDLSADRNHPTKRNRPLASGAAVPIKQGVFLMPLLFLASVAIAACVSWQFLGVLLFYFALTNAYTCWLKTKMVIDVVALAAAAGFNAVTVFALYVSSDAVHTHYHHPRLLWCLVPAFGGAGSE